MTKLRLVVDNTNKIELKKKYFLYFLVANLFISQIVIYYLIKG